MIDFSNLSTALLALLTASVLAVFGVAIFCYGYSAGWKIFKNLILKDQQKWSS